MQRANISIYGLYSYLPTIFENMVVPAGVDKDNVVDNIILECSELESLYPDGDFMKLAIEAWSKKELPVWEHLQATTQYEYNPIWNKDGSIKETYIDKRETQQDSTASGTSQSVAGSDSERSEDVDATHKVAAYNDTGTQIATQDEKGIDASEKSRSYDSAANQQKANLNANEIVTHHYERIEKGNIGITTTQQMISEERMIATFNIVDYIVQSFKERFCLLVY